MIRNLKFRWKLALLVAVPLLALLVTTTLGVASRLKLVQQQQDALALEAPAAALTRAVEAVQQEHALSSWYIATADPSVLVQLQNARTITDSVLRGLPAAQRRAADAGATDAARRMHDVATLASALAPERQRVDDQTATATELLDLYGGGARVAVEALEILGRGSQDAPAAANLRDYATLVKIANAVGTERAVILGALARGALPADLANAVVASGATQDADQAAFLAQADDDLRQVFAANTDRFRATTDQVRTQRNAALAGRLTEVTPAQWSSTTGTELDGWFKTADAVRAKAHQIESDKIAESRTQAWLYVGGTVLVFLLAIGIAIAVGRATVRPLRRLTRAARDVSERKLPHLVDALQREDEEAIPDVVPIPINSRDEIGELAGAFNKIEDTAVTVARDQRRVLRKGIGDLYVSLARRNQSLLERQLKVIDELEVDEADPEKLDALFRLDHLATRMRRNAESLLVIAGVEAVRPHTEPVPLREVVRGALSEIADYARVDVVSIPEDLTVLGNVAVDLTHVLAELLENATSFSRPSTRVFVGGERDDVGFTITISDEGIGIPGERVDIINDLLENPPLPGLNLARSLGLVVVSRLAARIGVRVELRSAPDVGTSALVELPARLLVTGPVMPVAPMSRRGAPVALGAVEAVPPELAARPIAPSPEHAPALGRTSGERSVAPAAALGEPAPEPGVPESNGTPITIFTPVGTGTFAPVPPRPLITPPPAETPAPAPVPASALDRLAQPRSVPAPVPPRAADPLAAEPQPTHFTPVGAAEPLGEAHVNGAAEAEPDYLPRPERMARERRRRRRGRRREPTPKPLAVPVATVAAAPVAPSPVAPSSIAAPIAPAPVAPSNGSGDPAGASSSQPTAGPTNVPVVEPSVTTAGLPRRTPAPADVIDLRHEDAPLAPSARPPDEVFELVARFEAGRRRVGTTDPNAPTDPPSAASSAPRPSRGSPPNEHRRARTDPRPRVPAHQPRRARSRHP